MPHPFESFRYCPKCGSDKFVVNNEKSKHCNACGFVYYFNIPAAVAAFIYDKDGRLLVVRRAKDPAKGSLDLPGGFVDANETAEQAIRREIREETGLQVQKIRYMFSLPNIYTYSDFNVHTLDLFYETEIQNTSALCASDDAAEVLWYSPENLQAEWFGLDSIRKAIRLISNVCRDEIRDVADVLLADALPTLQ